MKNYSHCLFYRYCGQSPVAIITFIEKSFITFFFCDLFQVHFASASYHILSSHTQSLPSFIRIHSHSFICENLHSISIGKMLRITHKYSCIIVTYQEDGGSSIATEHSRLFCCYYGMAHHKYQINY